MVKVTSVDAASKIEVNGLRGCSTRNAVLLYEDAKIMLQ